MKQHNTSKVSSDRVLTVKMFMEDKRVADQLRHDLEELERLIDSGLKIEWCFSAPFEIIEGSHCDLCGYPLMTNGVVVDCSNELCGRMTESILGSEAH